MKAKAQPTILVVDDDPDFLEQTRLRLQAAGYAVVTAESESAGRTAIAEQAFDLAVLDLMIDHFDSGFTLAYAVKRKDRSIPVILVSGVTSETGMMFESATPGERSWIRAEAILDKPIRFEQLEHEIQRLLGTPANHESSDA